MLGRAVSNARCDRTRGQRPLLAGSTWPLRGAVSCSVPALSRPVVRLLARDDASWSWSRASGWVDPCRTATLSPPASGRRAATDEGDRWQQGRRRHPRASSTACWPGCRTQRTGAGAAVWDRPTGRGVLCVGSSFPVRDLDLARVRSDPPPVYANRGLAGIDGNLSTAAGIALSTGRPTTALVGDLTALHDLTGLLRSPSEPVPDLRVVVANDGGGSIFATLERASRPGRRVRAVFGTVRHAVDFAALAAGAGGTTPGPDAEAWRRSG